MNSTARNNTVSVTDTIDVVNNIFQCFILISTIVGNLMLIFSLKIRQTGGLKLVDKLMLNTVFCNVLLVIISIPIELSVQHIYHYTNIACKLIDPLSTYFLNSCVFTYVAIAFERWILVSSMNYGPPTKVHTFLVFLAIHVCGLFSVSPYMPVLKVKDDKGRIVCDETWEISSRKSYTISLFLLQYGVPVPLLVVFYTKTWFIVYNSNKKLIMSMIQSSIKTMMTTTSLHADNNGRESLLVTSTTRIGSPDMSSKDCVASKMLQKETDLLQDCNHAKYDDSSHALLSPRYLARQRQKSRHPVHFRSTLSLPSPSRSPLATPPTSPHASPSASPLTSARDLRYRDERPRSYSVIPPSSPVAHLKVRSGSGALGRRISRYFSVTGGVSLKECQQVTALKRREKQTRRLLIRFTIITSVFIACMLPNQVHWLIIDFVEKGNEYFSELTRVLIHLITYANCVINPLLYGHYDRQFRANVCRFFRNIRNTFGKQRGTVRLSQKQGPAE